MPPMTFEASSVCGVLLEAVRIVLLLLLLWLEMDCCAAA